MSTYLGYRIIIGDTAIPETMMIKESYGTTPTERVIYTWKDANQIEHNDVAENPKMEVVFTLRKRTLAEQETLVNAFANLQNITVTYWDDRSCTYKTGLFKMDPPQFINFISQNEMWYNATQIHLTEY